MRATSRPLAQFVACLTILASVLLPAHAQDAAQDTAREAKPGGSEKRIALVVGNADYKAGALATPANDAGLVAQTLQAAGFDVVGARDLDEDALRKAMRDFTDKAAASGPDTVAFVYLSGYGLQLAGENYFAPIDAQIGSAADVPVQSLRVSDYKRRLAAIPLKARFVVLDGARNNPFVKSGDPLAGGLAMTEADPGSLIAFNAAPGTVGPEEKGPYGAYAQALVEMIREGGLPPDQLFDRVRLRVSETTQGAEVPWNASKLEPGFVFFQRAADAPKLADPETVSALESRPLKELGPKEAYSAALKRDTVQGYQEFADAYPKERVTKRVRALAAARRESITWRRTYEVNTPNAYWSYLSRYPRGPHAYDCRRRLRELSVALEPPPSYAAIDYDIPPPPPEEIVYVERPAIYFADPVYDLPPPPPPPVVYLPPPPAYIVDLPPPPPVYDYFALPVPAFAPLPAYVAPPAYITPPVNNVYYTNIHNTVVINEINRENRDYSERRRLNPALAVGAGAVAGAALGAAAARVALPPAVQQRAIANPLSGGPNPRLERDRPDQANRNGVMPGTLPGAGPNGRANLGQPLPGQRDGRPLPQQDGRPGMANRPDDRNGTRPGDRPDTRPGDRQADQRDDKLRPGFGERRDNDPRIAGRPDPKDRPDAKDRDDPRIAGKPGAKDRPDGKDLDDPRLIRRPDAKDRDDPRIAGRPGAKDRPDGKDLDDPRLVGKPDGKDRPDAKDRDDPRIVGKSGGKDRDDPRLVGKPDPKDRPDARDRDRPQQVDRRDDRRDDRLQAVQERREQLRQDQAEKREAAQAKEQAKEQAKQQAARDAAQQRLQGGAQRGDPRNDARGGDPRGEAVQRQQQLQADRLEKQQAAARQREAAQDQRQQMMQQQQQQRAAAQRDAAQAQAQAQRQQAQAAAQQQRMAAQQQQAQQRQMMQLQQAQQQRQQMMQQQQQQAAQQRQMMMQQQAAQRQQMMSRPPPQPHGGGGGGHGCRPGMPCR